MTLFSLSLDLGGGSLHPVVSVRHGELLEDGTAGACVAADVRLDNRRELTASLAAFVRGESPSDAELLLAAWLRWGPRCPEHLLGDFAFVLWDRRSRQIFAACDPFGTRPLYYTRRGHALLVASEVRQILEDSMVPRTVDLETLGDYLAGHQGSSEKTFFRGVLRLPPAHRLLATATGERVERYWDGGSGPAVRYRRSAEYADNFRHLLEDAVAVRLPAGPVGVALSGGLDSSAVAALASGISRRAGGPSAILPSSFVFSGLPDCDERPAIQAVAEAAGLTTDFIEAGDYWFLSDDSVYASRLDAPLLSWEACLQEMFRRLRGRGANVLLTGHGADDLLHGSSRIYLERMLRGDLRAVGEVLRYTWSSGRGWRIPYRCFVEPVLPLETRQRLRRLAGRPGPEAFPGWIDGGFARRTGLAERLAAPQRWMSARQEVRHRLVDLAGYRRSASWYHSQGAQAGFEVRHPFLDRRLFEFVLAIPPEQLSRLGSHKWLLRRAVEGLVPDAVRLRRTKVRLGSFVDLSLREKAAERIERLFAPEPLAVRLGILDGPRLRTAYQAYRRGEGGEPARKLWYAVTLELWLRQHPDLRCAGGLLGNDEYGERAA